MLYAIVGLQWEGFSKYKAFGFYGPQDCCMYICNVAGTQCINQPHPSNGRSSRYAVENSDKSAILCSLGIETQLVLQHDQMAWLIFYKGSGWRYTWLVRVFLANHPPWASGMDLVSLHGLGNYNPHIDVRYHHV